MSDPSYDLPPPPIPAYNPTPITTLPTLIQTLHDNHHTHRKTHDIAWRIKQLQALYYALLDIQPLARASLTADLGRAEFENHFADFCFVRDELVNTIKNLRNWIADEPVTEGVPWYLRLSNETYIRKDPLGVVLVIGAWNYPWNLNLLPFIGAIAAGNSVVLKPSEVSPHTASVLQKLVEVAGLDRDYYRVVLGGVDETTVLLAQKWDKICFTGSTGVGRIVMRAAAENLTPVLLELGGKNPCVVSPTADIPLAAKRIAWAKVLNSGQSCTAPDYLFIPEKCEEEFLAHFRAALEEFFPGGLTPESKDYTRIVNDRHFSRLVGLLEGTRGEVKVGGKVRDHEAKLMEPTLVKLGADDWEKDVLMGSEIFGPIMAYRTYNGDNGISQLFPVLRRHSDTSLGSYIFSTSRDEQQEYLSHTRSGGACINEAFMNTFIAGLPFGGVGYSGMGCYRGRFSVDSFLHRRSIVRNRGRWTDWVVSGWRFPPFTKKKFGLVQMMVKSPGFARVGTKWIPEGWVVDGVPVQEVARARL